MINKLKLVEKSIIIPSIENNTKIEKKKSTIWDRMFRKNKLKKPNKIAVIYLRKNGVAEPMEVESKNGFFNINNRTYHEDKDCIYRLGKDKYPFAMIQEWNVTPIGRKEWEDKDMQEKFHTLEDHVMKGIRHAERVRMEGEGQMKLNPKTLVVLGIMAIIAIAFIVNYQ